MRRVNGITKTTNNRFLNMYELDMKSDEGKHSKYFVASRAERIEDLKISTRENKADGVIIYSVYRDEETKEEKLVLIRQYRCPIDDYVYEFPAGLVDVGEDFKTAGIRELKEETGAVEFDIKPICVYSVKGKTRVNENLDEESFGMLYYADINSFEELHSEIETILITDKLVDSWTYPLIQPKLIEEAQKRGFI